MVITRDIHWVLGEWDEEHKAMINSLLDNVELTHVPFQEPVIQPAPENE
jgi:hypothetical protein